MSKTSDLGKPDLAALAKTIPDDPLSRRAFVKVGMGLFGVAYAGLVAYPIYRYLATPAVRAEAEAAVTSVELPDAGTLAAGSALMFRFGSKPALLIHHANDTWVAFSAVCTHLGCTVQYEPQNNRIHCACHGGTYDPNTGKNISGPPPRPLTMFAVEVTNGKVVVKRT